MSRALEKMSTSSAPPSASSEQLKQIDETLRALIDTMRNQSERLKKIEEEQARVASALSSQSSTSTISLPDSLTSDVDAIKLTLNKQSEMLAALSETVSDKRVVKQSDGSVVSGSELQAHSMMKTLSAELARMTSSLNNLTASVKAKSNVTLNAEKVAEVVSRRVTEHFDQAVDVPMQGLRSDLEGLRSEMGALGNEKLAEVEKSVEGSLKYLNDARRNIEDIERRVTFVGIGRLTLATLPVFASLLIVGGLVWGLGTMLGIGPVFSWAWASFAAASIWWHKVLIALATLGGAAGFIWLVLRLARWIYDELG